MARNEEKHVTRLNRLLLQQQREEAEKKNPKRPHLNTLNSAGEIQKWLPSIKKDLDFYLKQSQVNCYPARKIEEFSVEIERLKKEYHAFVRKLKQHDPTLKSVPWTERPYGIKTKVGKTKDKVKTVKPSSGDSANVEDFVKITTPILDQDEEYGQLYGYDRIDDQQSPNLHSYLPFDNHQQAPSLVEKDQNQQGVTGTYQDDKPLNSSTQNEKDFCLWNKPLVFVSIKSAVPDTNTAVQTLTRVSSKFGIDAHTANKSVINAFDEYDTSAQYLPDNVLDSASENLETRQPASQKTVGCSSDLNQVNALNCLASEYCEVSSDSDSDAAKT